MTAHLERQRKLFEGVFGLVETAAGELDGETVRALWDLEGRTARTVLLETPGTSVGVQLVELTPSPELAIREGAKGTDHDALKVIDFVVSDMDRGVAHLEKNGFSTSGPIAEYSLPRDGRFSEAHLEGPDGVKCALLQMHDQPLSRWVRVADRLFSEILGFSAPVAKAGPVDVFYRQTLGFELVYHYSFESDGFAQLVGAERTTTVRGFNYGTSTVDPMIGVIHYGLPEGTTRSLRSRAAFPHRGLAAVRLETDSVARVVEACQRSEGIRWAGPQEVEAAPWGRARSLLVEAPHAVLHHFIERLPA